MNADDAEKVCDADELRLAPEAEAEDDRPLALGRTGLTDPFARHLERGAGHVVQSSGRGPDANDGRRRRHGRTGVARTRRRDEEKKRSHADECAERPARRRHGRNGGRRITPGRGGIRGVVVAAERPLPALRACLPREEAPLARAVGVVAGVTHCGFPPSGEWVPE